MVLLASRWFPLCADSDCVFITDILRIELLRARRADAVAEFCLRMLRYVGLDAVPVSLVIADILTGSADGKQSAERLDFGKGVSELAVHQHQ